MNSKLTSYISLAMKAGKIKSGEFASEESIRKNKTKLVIVALDASDNTKKKFNNLSKNYDIDIVSCLTKDELGRCLGKEERSVICILDEGFKRQILKML